MTDFQTFQVHCRLAKIKKGCGRGKTPRYVTANDKKVHSLSLKDQRTGLEISYSDSLANYANDVETLGYTIIQRRKSGPVYSFFQS